MALFALYILRLRTGQQPIRETFNYHLQLLKYKKKTPAMRGGGVVVI